MPNEIKVVCDKLLVKLNSAVKNVICGKSDTIKECCWASAYEESLRLILDQYGYTLYYDVNLRKRTKVFHYTNDVSK